MFQICDLFCFHLFLNVVLSSFEVLSWLEVASQRARFVIVVWFANGGCFPYDLLTILPSSFLLFDLMFRFGDLWFVLFGLGLGAIVQGQHADTTQKSVLCMHAIPDHVPNNIGKVFAGQPEPMT